MRALIAASLLLAALAGCTQPEAAARVATAQAETADIVTPAAEAAQAAAAEALVPTLLDARAIVQEALPEPVPDLAKAEPTVAPAAVALIIRWEVTSPQVYERRYRAPVWPGGQSGVTWGVGYDGGHQTRATIRRDWRWHQAVLRMQDTSGVIGAKAKPLAASMRDVQTPFADAQRVFADATLPAYRAAARQALGPEFEDLPPNAAGALVSLGYNRGWSFRGDRRREMRKIRDDCVPEADTQCIADELRAMKRLWPEVEGLRDRRDDEARLATL